MSRLSISLVCALLLSCGSLPPGAQRANQLLARGDYDGAEKEADRELARFPEHPALWSVKVRAAMGRGDNAAAVAQYASWRDLRGRDDADLLRTMANTAIWQALRTPSAEIKRTAVQLVERLELERFAADVGELVLDDDDLVAAAASVAVLRSNPAAPRVATDLLRSDNPRARAIVVAGIGAKIGSRARDDLLPALKDPDSAVRQAAVTAVGGLTDPADTEALLTIARGDGDGPVRAAAIAALGKGRRPGAISLAISSLDDSYLGARLAAVQLIAERGSADERGRLVELTRGDDLFVALRAATALARAGAGRIAAPVEAAITAEPWTTRSAAIGAASALLDKPRLLDLVGRRLADPRIEVRLAAARVMLQLGIDRRARPIFVEALGAADESARLQGATGLVRLRDPRGLEALSALCQASAPSTRAGAVFAHARADRPSPGLVSALADDLAIVRLDAAETLLLLTD